MQKTEKERVVAELTEQLRRTDSLIVADYRGLTNVQLEELRAKLRPHGARFSVVKNTLTRRAAEAAGAESLLALLEGPVAIAFVETEGDPVAVAKALADTARETKIMVLRGGVLDGAPITGDDVEALAKLPPVDMLRAQLVGAIVAPLTQLAALLAAPLRDLVGLIDARIAQLEERGDTSASAAPSAVEEAPSEEESSTTEAPVDTAETDEAPSAVAEVEVEEPPEAVESARDSASAEAPAPGETENTETENDEEE
jgi:large subunit ribosomal protein L10